MCGRSLTVGCPAFNEEAAIESVVRDAIRKLPTLVDDWELLLVDDGSTDSTRQRMEELRHLDPRIRVIFHPYNLGFRGIAQTLTRNARMDLYAGISCDGEMDLTDLQPMLQKIHEGCDVVVGVRPSKPNYGLYRRIVSNAYNGSIERLFGLSLRDAGWLKLWKIEALRQTDDAISRSAFMNAERLVKAHHIGYHIGFVEVQQHPRLGGKPKGASFKWVRSSMVDLVRVAWDVHTRWTPPPKSGS